MAYTHAASSHTLQVYTTTSSCSARRVVSKSTLFVPNLLSSHAHAQPVARDLRLSHRRRGPLSGGPTSDSAYCDRDRYPEKCTEGHAVAVPSATRVRLHGKQRYVVRARTVLMLCPPRTRPFTCISKRVRPVLALCARVLTLVRALNAPLLQAREIPSTVGVESTARKASSHTVSCQCTSPYRGSQRQTW